MLRRFSDTAVSVMLSCWAAGATAAPLLEASTVLLSGTYQVADLAPDDGFEARASVQPSGWTHFSSGRYRSDLGLSEDVRGIEGGLFSDLPAADVVSPGVNGAISGSSQFLTVSEDLSYVRDFLGAVTLGSEGWQSMETGASLSPAEGFRIVIGAHSSITFTGFATPTVSIDHQALLGSPELQAVLAQGHTVSLKSHASIQLNLYDPHGPCCESNQFAYFEADLNTLIDPVTGVTVADSGLGTSPLQLTFENHSDQEVIRVIDMRSFASVSAAILPVPEPGTWALMALGLLGMGVAVRQQRRPDMSRSG